METVEELTEATTALLDQIGAGGPHTLSPLPAGANNRAYRVDAGRQTFFLKHYFHQGEERLAPLGHEWDFSTFCWNHNLKCVAEPLACDPKSRLSLFEYVSGRRVGLMGAGPSEIESAARFFRDVNRHRRTAEAKSLPAGAEASFSLASSLNRIASRLAAFESIELKSPACELAADFLRTQLVPAWNEVRTTVEQSVPASALSEELSEVERCLSPVDFGFHNVLIREDGSLLFHDFEEAGWDDPARMICDFFCSCQMQLSAPIDLAPEFCRTALADFDAASILRRAARLWPAGIIQWCCVVLTDFLPVAQTRRSYAGQPPSEMRRHRQLEMAERLLARRHTPLPL